jgi:hypothetical protein
MTEFSGVYDEIHNQLLNNAVDYDKIVYDNCKTIRTGDIICAKDVGLMPWLIRYATRGGVNHVGIVVKIDDTPKEHIMVAEATPNGVRIHPYNYYYIQSSCMVGRVFDELEKEQRDALREESLRHLGTPYDWRAYIPIIYHILTFGRKVPENDLSESTKRFICSEYVPLIYYRALRLKLVNKKFQHTTPADIALSPKIQWFKHLDGTWEI